jgi:hypothetical protein
MIGNLGVHFRPELIDNDRPPHRGSRARCLNSECVHGIRRRGNDRDMLWGLSRIVLSKIADVMQQAEDVGPSREQNRL